MAEITEILIRILNIIERVSTSEEIPAVVMGIFGVVMVFGTLNCVLGYRLLRFWVMLFGFAAGAFAGLFVVRSMGVEDKTIYLAAMVGLGVAVGIVAFLIYKLGIFILGAGIAWTLSIYILHPTTSFVFFVCILLGVAVGTLAVRFAREVIIVGTSLLGGVMAGFSLSRLGGLAEIPYGIAMSVGFALLGLLVQFATNKVKEEDGDDEKEERKGRQSAAYGEDAELEDELYDNYEDDYEEEVPVRRRKANVPDVKLEDRAKRQRRR